MRDLIAITVLGLLVGAVFLASLAQAQTRCTSTRVGNTVYTTCY